MWRPRCRRDNDLSGASPDPNEQETSMAVYDLEEQEKLDDLKAWWHQWGNLVSGVVLAIALGVLGVQGWRWWQGRQAEQASVLFTAISAAVKSNDVEKAKEAYSQLTAKFSGTGYAPRAAMLVSKLQFDAGDAPGAMTQLNFVLDRSDEDELKQIARVRLAEILLDAKRYDDALRTLDAKRDEPFAGVYEDLRGDILVAAGRASDARMAYQTALSKLDAKSPYHGFVQAKLDAIGGPQVSIPGSAPLTVQPANAPSGSAPVAPPPPAPPKGSNANPASPAK
jgi:predicted negative regulator of RcsB-dependent stress response